MCVVGVHAYRTEGYAQRQYGVSLGRKLFPNPDPAVYTLNPARKGLKAVLTNSAAGRKGTGVQVCELSAMDNVALGTVSIPYLGPAQLLAVGSAAGSNSELGTQFYKVFARAVKQLRGQPFSAGEVPVSLESWVSEAQFGNTGTTKAARSDPKTVSGGTMQQVCERMRVLLKHYPALADCQLILRLIDVKTSHPCRSWLDHCMLSRRLRHCFGTSAVLETDFALNLTVQLASLAAAPDVAPPDDAFLEADDDAVGDADSERAGEEVDAANDATRQQAVRSGAPRQSSSSSSSSTAQLGGAAASAARPKPPRCTPWLTARAAGRLLAVAGTPSSSCTYSKNFWPALGEGTSAAFRTVTKGELDTVCHRHPAGGADQAAQAPDGKAAESQSGSETEGASSDGMFEVDDPTSKAERVRRARQAPRTRGQSRRGALQSDLPVGRAGTAVVVLDKTKLPSKPMTIARRLKLYQSTFEMVVRKANRSIFAVVQPVQMLLLDREAVAARAADKKVSSFGVVCCAMTPAVSDDAVADNNICRYCVMVSCVETGTGSSRRNWAQKLDEAKAEVAASLACCHAPSR